MTYLQMKHCLVTPGLPCDGALKVSDQCHQEVDGEVWAEQQHQHQVVANLRPRQHAQEHTSHPLSKNAPETGITCLPIEKQGKVERPTIP